LDLLCDFNQDDLSCFRIVFEVAGSTDEEESIIDNVSHSRNLYIFPQNKQYHIVEILEGEKFDELIIDKCIISDSLHCPHKVDGSIQYIFTGLQLTQELATG